MKSRRSAVGLILASFISACGGVMAIDVHDERVPLEARQWVGGADDGVAIAEAGVDEARADAADIAQWKQAIAGRKAQSAALASPLGALVAAREKLADLRVDDAEATLELAKRTRTLVHAETAMRYDLAVYDLKVLRAAVESARSEHERLARAVEEAIVVRESVSAAFWSAYRSAYAQSPEVGGLFWGIE